MIPPGADSAEYAPARRMYVPIERADLTTFGGWLELWPYLWVIPVLAFAWWRPQSFVPDAVTLALAPPAVWLFNFRIFEQVEYGTYVSSAAVTGLWLLAVLETISWWRRRRARAPDA
ncbi:MAG: hypothetical protein OEW19_03495 [Acidobacteriota bacterium]|nr:hypothetical protein [Acidobacteriota bacterium]